MSSFHAFLLRENQLSLSPVDPVAEKAAVYNDGFQKLFRNLVRFYQIEGNNRATNTRASTIELEAFAREQTIAMAVINSDFKHVQQFPEDMRWDVVSMPVFEDQPGVADQPSPWMYSVTSTSKHKDEAFEVIAYLLSDEFLMRESKRGIRTPTTNEAIRQAFGSDSELMDGKNVGAYYYHASAPVPNVHGNPQVMSVGLDAANLLNSKFLDVIIDGKDINTALREADEEINVLIQQAKME